MLGAISPTHSTIEGDGVVPTIAKKAHTVKVTAKNYSRVDIGTGGAVFYIQVTNHCTFTSNFECTAVGSAETTIHTDIFQQMTDNGDGTYTYDYIAEGDGKVTIVVILMNQGMIYSQYWTSNGLSGTPALTTYATRYIFNS